MHGKHGGSGAPTNVDAARFGDVPVDLRKVVSEKRTKVSLLRWIQRDKGIVRGLSDGGVDRRVLANRREAGVALVVADNGIEGFEHGDVNNGERPGGAAGPELFTEHPI